MVGKHKTDSPDFAAPDPKFISGDPDVIFVEEAPELEIVPGPTKGSKGKGGLSEYEQELAFNEEIIEVMLHESTDANAENPAFTGCNGISQYFYRGIPQQVKRKYVAILASVKEHNVSTPEYTTADGTRQMGIKRTSSLKYPFSIISDPNPRGAAWLRSLLQAPT